MGLRYTRFRATAVMLLLPLSLQIAPLSWMTWRHTSSRREVLLNEQIRRSRVVFFQFLDPGPNYQYYAGGVPYDTYTIT